jgi:mono/diheme cytochrome c family protein
MRSAYLLAQKSAHCGDACKGTYNGTGAKVQPPRRVVCLAGVLAGLAGASGCRSTPPLTPQQLEGQHLYDVRCAHCHELNDLALKKVPPSLRGVFNSATLPSGAPATDLNVERTILSGKGMMPSFAGRFNDEQMAALLAYLHAGLR